ncbi:hypothetical protein [Cytobacillus horneckiae]|uniref:hypothetical protein n=1 Tax=Cytobacillus horneckiae TaxID=549687 RepID=UPI00203F7CCE|nr:hypothetical protein [Cytobacillus horneckiae]MCM3180250.1 hypothetical protein [Cytobacillus horneckiae]
MVQAFLDTDQEGNVTKTYCGINIVAREPYPFFFQIEDYMVDQLFKCKVVIRDGKPELVAKDGEVIEIPELTEEERRIKELEDELNRLRIGL